MAMKSCALNVALCTLASLNVVAANDKSDDENAVSTEEAPLLDTLVNLIELRARSLLKINPKKTPHLAHFNTWQFYCTHSFFSLK